LCRDKNISLYAERALYGTQGYILLIHVRVANTTGHTVSAHLRDRFEMFYPNQVLRVDLDAERSERLLAGAAAHKAEDIGKFRYPIVSMAGQLFYTDGTTSGHLTPKVFE
jgi:hypothetical protein